MIEWSKIITTAAVSATWVQLLQLITRVLLEMWRDRSSDRSLGEQLWVAPSKPMCYVSTKSSIPILPEGPIGALPVEVILSIADHLKPENRVSLSLTCKHFNHILRKSSLELSLNDVVARVNFLHLLERDHPEFLTCRPCGKVYLWQNYQHLGYICPHALWHTPTSPNRLICDKHHVFISREIVDLISRRLRDGIHISWLNFRGTNFGQIPGNSEARWVDGRILIAFNWVWEFKTRQDVMKKDWQCNPRIRWQDRLITSICAHHSFDWGRLTESALRWSDANLPMDEGRYKCKYCDTDYLVDIQVFTDGRIRVQVKAWSNLGSRDHQSLATDQYYNAWTTTLLDDEFVASRDLESLFATGESTHAACQHKTI